MLEFSALNLSKLEHWCSVLLCYIQNKSLDAIIWNHRPGGSLNSMQYMEMEAANKM